MTILLQVASTYKNANIVNGMSRYKRNGKFANVAWEQNFIPNSGSAEKTGCCNGFENFYIVGEGSGYSGGIISSGSGGVKAAMNIIERNC